MLSLVQSPDPLLNTVCEPCDFNDKSLKRLAKQMAHVMYKNAGCGLAAPQVGVLKRLVVIDCDQEDGAREPIVMLNPVIVARRYYDLDGQLWEIEGDGLLGRCLQHETDHLDGVTMFERAEPMARLKALEDYERALAAGARPGETSVEA